MTGRGLGDYAALCSVLRFGAGDLVDLLHDRVAAVAPPVELIRRRRVLVIDLLQLGGELTDLVGVVQRLPVAARFDERRDAGRERSEERRVGKECRL